MKALHIVICTAGLVAGSMGTVRAADMSPDASDYKAKMHECITQMKTEHADMNHKARQKACRDQMGPSPKGMQHSSPPAPSTPPATPPASPPAEPTSPPQNH